MTWDGTDGRELTYSADSKFADSSFGGSTPQILSGFDVNNDGIDDIAVVSEGSSNSGRISIFFGKSTWSASVDGSTDFDGTSTGFSFMDAANARLGRGLTVGDINGDGIDDVVASSRSDQPFSGTGCIYVLYGGVRTRPPLRTFMLMSMGPLASGCAAQHQTPTSRTTTRPQQTSTATASPTCSLQGEAAKRACTFSSARRPSPRA